MNAIELLKVQHGEINKLLSLISHARTPATKRRLVEEVADQLLSHAAIEEHQFYPAVRALRSDEIRLASLEAHIGIGGVLASLLETGVGSHAFESKVAELRRAVEHHVREEEQDLFPKMERLLDADTLDALGVTMHAEYVRLTAGHPWRSIWSQDDRAAAL